MCLRILDIEGNGFEVKYIGLCLIEKIGWGNVKFWCFNMFFKNYIKIGKF